MRIINFLFLTLALFLGRLDGKYWEFLSREEQSIAVKSLSPLAREYFIGSFSPTDDEMSFSLLDYLTEQDESLEITSLKFYLFNRVVFSVDGALAEVLGDYCIQWLHQDGQYVLEYLQYHPKLEELYLMHIGETFSYDSEKDAYKQFCDIVLDQFREEQRAYPRRFLIKLNERIKYIETSDKL